MLEEFVDGDAAHFAGPALDRTGVIDDDVIVAGGVALRLPGAVADEDHGVERGILRELPVEEQISGTGVADIPRNKEGIELLERLGIRKFREGAVLQILRKKSSWPRAKKCGTERRERVTVFLERGERRGRFDLGLAEPSRVVGAQSVAIGVTEQGGAVVDFARQLVQRAKGLEFGDEDEPATKGFLIRRGVEARSRTAARAATREALMTGLGMFVTGRLP